MPGLELPMTALRDECRLSLPAMGSTVEVVLLDAPPGSDAWVRTRLSALERAWSRFDQRSELVALNRRAGGAPVPASDLLRTAVDASLQLWRATDGWFDPTTLRALEWAGYDRSFTEVRSRSGSAACVGSPPATPTPLGVIVDDDRGTITLPAGVTLDLGGVGKGLAADLLATELMERGSSGVLVSVGGDIAVAGTGPDGGWRIPVVDPTDGHRVRWVVPIESGAIVQSNRLVRQWRAGDEHCHHLIDPSTSLPSRSGIAAAVVVSDRAWWAEGVAKAALLAGAAAGSSLIGRLAKAGWLVRDNGTVTLAGQVAVGRAA